MQVGFIGLGTMGGKMAASLQRAGYSLMVYDTRREAAAPHLAAGAVWADSPRKVAQACEVVFTSLPGPADVEEVALGEDGVGLREGQGAAASGDDDGAGGHSVLSLKSKVHFSGSQCEM